MFANWLKERGLDRCYLIEIDCLVSGVLQTLYRSTHPYRSSASDTPALQPYPDTVLSLPEFDREMTEVFIGTSRVGLGEFELFLDNEVLALIDNPNAVFAGQEVRMYVGAESWNKTSFGQIMVGQIEQLDAASYDTAKISFRDRAELFNRPIQENTVASGPNENKPLPLCFGQCFNVSPVLIDPVTKKYQVHDGQVHAITAVRENGQPIGYTADLATGTFTLTYNAKGRITADVQGAVVDGQYLTTADEMLSHIIENIMQLPTPVGTALPAYTLGLYINKETTVADVLDSIVASVGGAWFFNRLNQVFITHFNGLNTATDTLTLDDVEDDSLLPVRRISPAKTVSIGYQRNCTPQADGLAGVIRENDPELATLYEQEESTAVAENAGLTSTHPEAAEINVSTLIALKADAQTEAQRRANLASAPHAVYELEAFAAPFAMQLGQTIHIDYPQYFNGGKDALIVRLTDYPEQNSVRMEVWR